MMCQNACVLVLEDDPLISLDAEDMLTELGARAVLLAHTIEEAAAFLATQQIDLAMLDLRIGTTRSDTFALALTQRGVPFIVTSGYGPDPDLHSPLADIPAVGKPYTAADLRRAFSQL